VEGSKVVVVVVDDVDVVLVVVVGSSVVVVVVHSIPHILILYSSPTVGNGFGTLEHT